MASTSSIWRWVHFTPYPGASSTKAGFTCHGSIILVVCTCMHTYLYLYSIKILIFAALKIMHKFSCVHAYVYVDKLLSLLTFAECSVVFCKCSVVSCIS